MALYIAAVSKYVHIDKGFNEKLAGFIILIGLFAFWQSLHLVKQ